MDDLARKTFLEKLYKKDFYWKDFVRRARPFNILYIMRTYKIGNGLCSSGFGEEEMDLIEKRLFP